MKILIVTGGNTERDFLKRVLDKYEPDYIIGVERGLQALDALGQKADLAVGDFDTLAAGETEQFTEEIPVIRLIPEKDDTDTEAAIREALRRNPESLVLLGATGTRLDHTLSNISLLLPLCEKGIPACIADSHNVIRIRTGRFEIKKKDCHGTYISLLPLGEEVTGLTLRGFKYNLDGVTLPQGRSLGVSNEIVEDTAYISCESGYLIVMETRD